MEDWFVIIGIALLVAVGVVFYMFSVASRKSYRCPQCGERFTTEHLDAKRCGHCGTELERED
jgi:ribosomal protein S27AE